MKSMTPKNIFTFKLYEILMFVKEDIKRAQKKGVELYMYHWCEKNEKVCTVCLAGAALLGFIDFKIPAGSYQPVDLALEIDKYNEDNLTTLAKILDDLRDCPEKAVRLYAETTNQYGEKVAEKAELLFEEGSFYLGTNTNYQEVLEVLDTWIEFFKAENF